MTKHSSILYACAFGLCAPPPAAAASESTAALEIVITDIETTAGEIVVAVFASDGSFQSREDPVAFAWLEVTGPVVRWQTELDAAVDYAVAVYQDQNGNRELDTNRLGRPTEPYGFSNNVRGVFGPPDFEDVSFRLEAGDRSISIRLK